MRDTRVGCSPIHHDLPVALRKSDIVHMVALASFAVVCLFRILPDEHFSTRLSQIIILSLAAISFFTLQKSPITRGLKLVIFVLVMISFFPILLISGQELSALFFTVSLLPAFAVAQALLQKPFFYRKFLFFLLLALGLYVIYMRAIGIDGNDVFAKGSRNHIISFLLPLYCLWFFLETRSGYSIWRQTRMLLITLLFATAFVSATGRTGVVVGGLIVLAVILFLYSQRRVVISVSGVFLLALVIVTLSPIMDVIPTVMDQSAGLRRFEHRGFSDTRWYMLVHWAQNLGELKYFWGYPPDYFERVFLIRSHNSFIRVSELLGMIGLAIFVLFSIFYFRKAYRHNLALVLLVGALYLRLSTDSVIVAIDFSLPFLAFFGVLVLNDAIRKDSVTQRTPSHGRNRTAVLDSASLDSVKFRC